MIEGNIVASEMIEYIVTKDQDTLEKADAPHHTKDLCQKQVEKFAEEQLIIKRKQVHYQRINN